MAIRRLLEGSGLRPEQIECLRRAYEVALHRLYLVDRDDPVTEMIARKIIQIGRTPGDPAAIAQRAIKALGIV